MAARRSGIGPADVIVVGLGAMGSAIAHRLAAGGAEVIGLDAFSPPHPYGSTHGETRITRLAIGEGPEYVPLVHRSHVLWRELEELSGETLFTQTGGLIIAERGNRFLERTRALAREHAIAHENLAPAELAARYPAFAPGADTEGYLEAGSGYVRPEGALRVQLTLARRHGAQLHLGERVRSWRAGAGGVSVVTASGEHHARQLVLCTGPWVAELFPQAAGRFAVFRQLQFWFPIRRGYEELRALPVFVWDFGGEPRGFVHFYGIYGFPALDGPDGGMKVATEAYTRATVPDGRQHPATRAEADWMYRELVAPRLPWLDAPPLRTVSCLYTNTRGSRFVVDRHPEHDNVLLVSACSGHGFKHSPAIGEALAAQLLGAPPAVDLAPFSLASITP